MAIRVDDDSNGLETSRNTRCKLEALVLRHEDHRHICTLRIETTIADGEVRPGSVLIEYSSTYDHVLPCQRLQFDGSRIRPIDYEDAHISSCPRYVANIG